MVVRKITTGNTVYVRCIPPHLGGWCGPGKHRGRSCSMQHVHWGVLAQRSGHQATGSRLPLACHRLQLHNMCWEVIIIGKFQLYLARLRLLRNCTCLPYHCATLPPGRSATMCELPAASLSAPCSPAAAARTAGGTATSQGSPQTTRLPSCR
jgi:hypothetical protein